MKIVVWGSTGSLPATMNSAVIRDKICAALESARGKTLPGRQDIERFVDTLPFPCRGTYGGNTSCVEIRNGDEPILLDAGSGIRDFGHYCMQAGKRAARFHVFMSHLHWDHLQGFPFFAPAFVKGNVISVYGCHRELKNAFIAQQAPQYFPVDLDYMKAEKRFIMLEPGKTYDIAGYKVTAIVQDHPGDSYGYCFERNGRKIVYSTDSEHRERPHYDQSPLVELSRDADLLIFDAQYSLMDSIDAKESWGHSSNMVGVEIAVRSNVKHLCLFHSEPTHDDAALHKTLGEAEKYAALYADASALKISLAYDGLEIDL
jgi:phosphoribosyl 1,2-cyclic phosphodiesterase